MKCTGNISTFGCSFAPTPLILSLIFGGVLTLSPSVCGLKDINKLSPVGAVELYEALCAGKGSELPVTYLLEIRKFSGKLNQEVYLSEILAPQHLVMARSDSTKIVDERSCEPIMFCYFSA